MKYAVVKEYFSRFSTDQPDVIISVTSTITEAVDAAVRAFSAEYPDGVGYYELRKAAFLNQKLKCEKYVLRIISSDQAIGYQGQEGNFIIANAASQNVFIRLLYWMENKSEILHLDDFPA